MRGSGVASQLSDYLSPTHLAWLSAESGASWREDEATLVFGDVSGFTALGERLARRGRVGAEDLTDAITAVFASMNDAIVAAGGEILKFGGDAILARFTGEEHQVRGTAAAVAMRETLEALRLPGLRGGVARLGMSIGVDSGPSHLFLAGTEPSDLIVTGPLATQVVTREGEASAGEIVLGERTADALAPGLSQARGGGAALLVGRPDAPPAPPAAMPPIDPVAGLPPHLHDHEPGDAAHRSTAVAFIKFSGSDPLLEEAGPDALAEALEAILSAVTQACADWGLTYVSSDVDANGGKLILAAGAPHASPDDDDRIVHALHEIVSSSLPLPVRAGVNRGPVFASDIGRPGRRVWSLMGDSVNLAARVMAHARPGTLLATPSVTKRLRDEFEREPVAPFKAKGKSAPVAAERIGKPRGSRVAETSSGPFVGREAELRLIDEALDEARRGGSRVIELVADPGIGKSRLVAAVRERAEGLTRVDIAGGPYAVRTPFMGVRRALSEILFPEGPGDEDFGGAIARRVRELDPELEPWTPLVASAFGVELPPTPETAALSPEFTRERLASALSRLLGLAAPPGPALVIVEDSHWLDEASLDFLTRLLGRGRATGDRGLAALITRRPGSGQLEDVEDIETVDLEPLGASAMKELLAPTVDDEAALGPREREELVAKAHGNPLLLGELAAAARAGENVVDLPDSVEALMNARIAGLPAGDQRLLREASIIGNEVSLDLLAEVLGVEPRVLAGYAHRMEEFLVPVRPGTVRFSHALLRDAAYSSLSYRRRRELHARAADALAHSARGHELDGILAIHYAAARRWPETWKYGRRAGEAALRGAAPHEARNFLRAAVDAARWVKGADRAELRRATVMLGEAAELAGSYDEARRAYARARRLAEGDPLEQGEILLREGRLREGASSVTQAIRCYRRGLDAVGGKRSREAASLRARLILAEGGTRLHSGRHRQAVPLLERAVAEAERAEDRAALGHAYYLLDWAHSDLGSADAARYRDLALPIFEELGDFDKQGRVLTNLGVNAYHEGDWAEALDLYERARVASDRAGDSIGASFNLNNVAEIRLEQGRVDDAERLLQDVLATWRAARFNFGVGNALRNLGRIETRRGNHARAGELFARGREALAAAGLEGSRRELDAFDAKRLLLAGEIAEARALAQEIQAAAKRIDVIPNLPPFVTRILALCDLREGRSDEGIALLRQAVAMSEGVSAIYELALALDALGEALGEEGAAERERANRLFERLDVVAPPATGVSGS